MKNLLRLARYICQKNSLVILTKEENAAAAFDCTNDGYRNGYQKGYVDGRDAAVAKYAPVRNAKGRFVEKTPAGF